jgi:hypothetical protein
MILYKPKVTINTIITFVIFSLKTKLLKITDFFLVEN